MYRFQIKCFLFCDKKIDYNTGGAQLSLMLIKH